jgi:hypothetical protein
MTTHAVAERIAFRGVPSFFKGNCNSASQGGAASYAEAGWHLSANLAGLVPYDATLDQWCACVDELREHLSNGDGDQALRWFLTYFPGCMRLVPERRRQSFMVGVRRAFEDERIVN